MDNQPASMNEQNQTIQISEKQLVEMDRIVIA